MDEFMVKNKQPVLVSIKVPRDKDKTNKVYKKLGRRVSNTHIPHLVVVKDAEEQIPVHGRRRRTTASESPQSSLSHHFPGTFTSLWHDLCAYLTRA